MKFRGLIFFMLVFLTISVSAQNNENWITADGYQLLKNHKIAFNSAQTWALKEYKIEANYFYIYSVRENDRGFDVYVVISENPKTKLQSYPGGFFHLYMNKNGEVYDVFWGT